MKRRIVAIIATAWVMLMPGAASAEVLEGDGMDQTAWARTDKSAEPTANERVILDAFVSPQAHRKAQDFVGLDSTEAAATLSALREDILAGTQTVESTAVVRD